MKPTQKNLKAAEQNPNVSYLELSYLWIFMWDNLTTVFKEAISILKEAWIILTRETRGSCEANSTWIDIKKSVWERKKVEGNLSIPSVYTPFIGSLALSC